MTLFQAVAEGVEEDRWITLRDFICVELTIFVNVFLLVTTQLSQHRHRSSSAPNLIREYGKLIDHCISRHCNILSAFVRSVFGYIGSRICFFVSTIGPQRLPWAVWAAAWLQIL